MVVGHQRVLMATLLSRRSAAKANRGHTPTQNILRWRSTRLNRLMNLVYHRQAPGHLEVGRAALAGPRLQLRITTRRCWTRRARIPPLTSRGQPSRLRGETKVGFDMMPNKNSSDSARKPYVSPRLTNLGSLVNLVAAGSMNRPENDNSIPCPATRDRKSVV